MIRLGPPLFRLVMGSACALSGPELKADDAGARPTTAAPPGEGLPADAPSPDAPSPDARPTVNPDAAGEGERDLAKTNAPLRKLVLDQPYGRRWRDLVEKGAAPRSAVGLGQVVTHGSLERDAMEVQQQSQYLEPTMTEVRYGLASIRGVRVFRFGKLRAVRLVIDPVGRAARDPFVRDVEAIAAAWREPVAALDLGRRFAVSRNDLVEQKKKRPSEWPAPPLVIELVPRERDTR